MSDKAAGTETDDGFQDTPTDWQRRWTMEFATAKDELSSWRKAAENIIRAFLMESDAGDTLEEQSRRPYFTAGVQTLRSILFGQTPKVSVARKFSDSRDDVARVAGEMLERILNEDIEHQSGGHDIALQHSLDDFLLAGLGVNRHRYVADWEEPEEGAEETPAITKPGEDGQPVELAPAVPVEPTKSNEDVETIYEHWQDQLWSPARTFEETRWWAFGADLTQKQLGKRFGEDVAKGIALNSKKPGNGSDEEGVPTPWAKARVWEIWDKEHERVFWFVEGHKVILDMKDDPLELEGFWPHQRPLFSNLTTSKLVPRPDYVLTQDIYKEIDEISTRIMLLQKAIRVAGVYPKEADEIERLLNEARINELIPVENWPKFMEAGGINGLVQWLPLEMISMALDKCRDMRSELKAELYELTGMSDILRGQAGEEATATEQSIKAKYASTRLQALQNEFARFASDGQRIRAEIMCKCFDAQTFIERSNVMRTPDAQMAQQAAEFLKANFYGYRIEIKPEAVALTDYAQVKSERSEVLTAISSFVQQAAPMLQMMPAALPFMLELLSWFVSGLKGASEIQGVVDRAITSAEQALQQQQQQPPQQQQPDPKLLANQAKAQGELQKIQAQTQSELVRMQAETQQLAQRKRTDAEMNVQEDLAKQKIKAGMGGALAAAPLGPPGLAP